jgi:SAM-dependent methyltransferase
MARLRAAYDVVAADYARLLPDTGYEAPLDLGMLEEFVRLLAASDHTTRVLDAGCGAGRMVTHLQSLSPRVEVVGIDVSEAMLELARARHPGSLFVSAELVDTCADDSAFDGVVAWYSIIHTRPERLGDVAAEFARILRPGGVALFGYQAGRGVRELRSAYGHDVELTAYLHETDDVVAALTDAGFEMCARLERSPLASERHPQGFVLARLR